MVNWPGQWGDVTRRGHVVTVDGPRILGTNASAPERLLFLRADEGSQGLVVVGKGHESGRALLWTQRDRLWVDLGDTHGNNAVETDGEFVYWQDSVRTFMRLSLSTQARESGVIPTHPDGTADGFLDCTEPSLLWTDTGRVREGLMLPQLAGAWLVGQHPNADAILARRGAEVRIVVQRPGLYEPRAAWVNGVLVVVVRAHEGMLVLELDPDTLPVWIEPRPPAPPPPTPTPPLPPPNPGGPMRQIIEQVRAKYGSSMNDDECVALCNEVAWIARDQGYGVSRKDTGTFGRRHDGQHCCHDVIMLRDGQYWDILGQAGAASVPQWQDAPSGRITDPARGWVAPIHPGGSIPDPIAPPPPTGLEQRVAALERWARSFGR